MLPLAGIQAMKGWGVVALTLAAAVGCTVRVLDHEPASAARAATEFAQVALIEGDLDRAYAKLAEDARRATSVEQFRNIIAAMHPGTRPTVVTATEFEPIPGQEGMNVFLHGRNGEEKFFYRFLMQGTAKRGYRVAGTWRGSGPYPPSKARKPLPTGPRT